MNEQKQSSKVAIITTLIVAVGSLVGVLGVATIDNWEKLPFVGEKDEESEISDTQKVSFILLDEARKPVSLARVNFIFNGAPEPRFTDDLGYVSISIPKRDEVRILISKEGFKPVRRTINLSADNDTPVEYILEPESEILTPKADEGNEEYSDDSGNDISEAENTISNDIMEPLEFFNLYFDRINGGLYEEAFQMLSQNYSGSHSDEVQAIHPSLCVPMLLSVEVYLMRSGAVINASYHA
jgi:hypothetical protein